MTIAEKLQLIARNVQKVFDSGRKAEYEDFWGKALDGSASGTYRFAGSCWNDKTFKPSKKITLTGNCNGCFYGCQITDMEGIFDELGFGLSFNNVTSVTNMFAYSKITHLPELDMSGFNTYNSMFANCTGLVGVEFKKGTVSNSGLNFSGNTNLSTESLKSILGALSLSVNGKSITFSTSHRATIESECSDLVSAATSAGWTIAYN